MQKHQASINELKRALREPNSKLVHREKRLSGASSGSTPEKKSVSNSNLQRDCIVGRLFKKQDAKKIVLFWSNTAVTFLMRIIQIYVSTGLRFSAKCLICYSCTLFYVTNLSLSGCC